MICFKCKKQIDDNASSCPHCGAEIAHKEQLKKEMGFRRWQRWFFYAVLAVVFIGMIGVIVKIYDTNTKLILEITGVEKTLEDKKAELSTAQNKLAELENLKNSLQAEKEKLSGDLTAREEEVSKKLGEMEKMVEEAIGAEKILIDLRSLSARKAEQVPTSTLAKIALGAVDFSGSTDTDGDGLSDDLEDALGTDKNNPDTDGDGYSDYDEMMVGYNPLGEGVLDIDMALTAQYVSKTLISESEPKQLWYVGDDGKRYFLGIVE